MLEEKSRRTRLPRGLASPEQMKPAQKLYSSTTFLLLFRRDATIYVGQFSRFAVMAADGSPEAVRIACARERKVA